MALGAYGRRGVSKYRPNKGACSSCFLVSLCGFQWQLGSEEGLIMRRIACARCGRRLPVKFGVMPRRCACGEEFEWAPLGGFGRSTAVLAAFALLMSPILVLIWFTRRLLQDSIVLYAVALIVVFYWFRVCETLLVRFGLVRMTGVKVE